MTEFSLTFGPHRLFGYRTGAGELLVVHDGPGVPSPLSLARARRLCCQRVRAAVRRDQGVLTTVSNA
jgi:hypothetical protein